MILVADHIFDPDHYSMQAAHLTCLFSFFIQGFSPCYGFVFVKLYECIQPFMGMNTGEIMFYGLQAVMFAFQ